ncbi:heme-binding protein [Arthrobacter sp. JZ12]|uniref:GlcG/HbpS family heme-binding protein n=1 Tax=Arthrobacter sp. JZ12 TaxID=2654190 RepID=UPI002B4871D9|nr:heme-binding protein [Arthrobacter sp. JZ12]WRH26253.1 heme-binding protein [Arthrobacter sp. JZ12]
MATSKFFSVSLAFASAAVLALGVTACSSTETATGQESEPPATTAPAEEQASGESTAPAGEDSEQGGEAVLTTSRLSVQAAMQAAEAALAQCQSDDLPFVSVAVVDRFGQVQALLRGDNAAQHTEDSARLKAYTAAAFGANTSELSERATGDGATIRDIPGTLFLPGGVTVRAGEAPIAGIGVGGAPDGAADEACAQAGLDAIADSFDG